MLFSAFFSTAKPGARARSAEGDRGKTRSASAAVNALGVAAATVEDSVCVCVLYSPSLVFVNVTCREVHVAVYSVRFQTPQVATRRDSR